MEVVKRRELIYLPTDLLMAVIPPVENQVVMQIQFVFKEAGNSFQHFSNSYTLKDEYYHCLPSDATIVVSYKFPIIGNQVAVILLI